jgi:putative flippase GtrA
MLERIYARLPEAHRQYLTFGFAGGVAYLVDNGILELLVRVLGFDPIPSRFVSIMCGMTTTWYLNRTLTFRDRRDQPLWLEYLRYCIANGIGALVNLGVYVVLVDNIELVHRFPEIGIAVGVAFGMVFNFFGSKYFVFRRV